MCVWIRIAAAGWRSFLPDRRYFWRNCCWTDVCGRKGGEGVRLTTAGLSVAASLLAERTCDTVLAIVFWLMILQFLSNRKESS